MYEVKLIENMTDFLEYTQIIYLIQDQMEYIGAPKSNEQIMETIKLVFESSTAKLMAIHVDSHPIGMAFFNVSIGMESGGKYIWLNEMHIHSNYRDKGYGSLLFEEIVNWGKDNGVLRVMGMVETDQERTLNFYRKQGAETYLEQIFSIKL